MPNSVEEVFPPDKYDYIPRVAVFKTHQRIKNGKLVKVDKQKLDETAAVHNRLFAQYGRFSPFSKGHTLDHGPDGAEVDESDQPDTCGGGFNLFVEKSPDPEEDEYILYCTWAIPKEEKEDVLKKYVSISAEWYPSKSWIYPFSLLKSSAPEIPDMPIIPLRYGVELHPGEEPPYSLVIDSPFLYSSEKETMPVDEKVDDKKDAKKDVPEKEPEDKAMKDAEDSQKKGAVQDKSDLGDIKQMLAALQPLLEVLPDLMQLVDLMKSEEGGEDPLQPADGPADKPVPEPEKGTDSKPAEKDRAFDNPVKFDASMPSSTNGCVPGFNKDKETYSVKNDEVLKYKADLEKAQAELTKLRQDQQATQKVAKDLYKESRKTKAEKWVSDLETVDMVAYKSEKEKQEDIEMLAGLDEDTAKIMLDRMKARYQRKLPDSTSVKEVAKYAVESEPDLGTKTPEEAHERAMQIIKSGMSVEQFYSKLKEGQKKS